MCLYMAKILPGTNRIPKERFHVLRKFLCLGVSPGCELHKVGSSFEAMMVKDTPVDAKLLTQTSSY